jgi:large subunit ribosomal protein L31e
MSEQERIYTVPLKEAWNAQRYRRSERAMMVLKAFAKRHMKADKIVVDTTVNAAIWARGIKSPPNKIRVKMTKEEDEGVKTVTITMADVDPKAEAKKARAEAKAQAKEAKKAKKEEPKAEAEAKAEEKPEEPAAEEKKE